MNVLRPGFTLLLLFLFQVGSSQNQVNSYWFFLGVGNNKLISDVVSLTSNNNSFIGELSGQVRFGARFYENYEVNVGVYARTYPKMTSDMAYSYNKFLGYSGSVGYEFRKSNSPWGIPFFIDFVRYVKNIDSLSGTKTVFYDHYSAFSYGPRLGVRYHFNKHFFAEAEVNLLYEHFDMDIQWQTTDKLNDYKLGSFKFIGLSLNYCL